MTESEGITIYVQEEEREVPQLSALECARGRDVQPPQTQQLSQEGRRRTHLTALTYTRLPNTEPSFRNVENNLFSAWKKNDTKYWDRFMEESNKITAQ